MAKEEHDWESKDYSEQWAAKDKGRAAEREAQFQAAIKWLAVFLDGRGRVMDLGSGPGTLAKKMLEVFPEMQMICVDGAEPMLQMARKELAGFGDKVSFAQADFSQEGWSRGLPHDLDGVVSARAIHNLRKLKPIEKVYQEVNGLLRPGGVFLNIERVNFSTRALRKFFRELRHKATGRLPGMDGAAPSLIQQFRLLKRAGFVDIDCFWREGNTAIVGGFKALAGC